MLKILKNRAVALVASVGLLGGVAWVAAGTTGAYFSDTHQGDIDGTIGSIHASVSGGDGADATNLHFTNMLPGTPQTVTVNYQNTGANNEDVYIVFNDATALSALNTLGTYGEVHLAANGNHVFDSANLNDRSSTCGAFDPAGCWPLEAQYKVASNVAPGDSGKVSFTFNFSGKIQNPDFEGGAWNSYPVTGQTTNSGTTGTGLPYEIVATQVGVTPGA